MNNSLFTQTFTRLKPVKYLASLVLLARLKNSASLSALILATLLLVACGGGGGGGGSSSGGGSPATKVANFNVVPSLDRMTLSWTNPARADIASINLSWAAYNKNDTSRNTDGDGYLIISNSTQTAAAASNEYNITTSGQSDVGNIADGFVIGGARLDASSAYVFSVQLYFKASGNSTNAAALQSPDITAPRVPRSLGDNPDADSFADTQVYSVDNPRSTSDGGNVTLRWTNPQVGAGNIASVILSYQSNLSSDNRRSITLTAPASSDQLLSGSAVSYIWTGLEPGSYNFTIQPTLGGIFAGIEVTPGMLPNIDVLPPAAANQITPIVTTDPVGPITGVFPDDGDVQYNLTITQQDDVADPKLSVRSTVTTGTCSITPADLRTLTYNADNQTSATYDVTGTAAGGACEIDFQVVEDRRSVTLSRSITFNAELPPLLIPQIFEDRVLRPANLNLRLDIIASKQDDSNTPDVTFPAVVASSSTPSCTATLIGSGGSPILQYTADANGTVSAAISTATATYNVSSPGLVPVADCGAFLFNVTEGSATVTTPLNPGISFGERNDIDLAPTVTTNPVGAITDAYPDDGAVSYTLSITKRDILLNPILNATATITGFCSITPTGVVEPGYGADNQARTDYNITYTGIATDGDTCGVEFIVAEDGESTTIDRSITFSAEQAPILVAELLDSGTGVSSTELVRVNVTATKQDGSNTPSITFPASVVSSACTATLAGDITRQYNGAIAGTSSVSVIYNVSPTIPSAIDDCGTFTFTAIEGSVTGMSTPQFSDPIISFVFVDSDNDGIADGMDVDADGDGLIELSTAAELNMMRHNLTGAGLGSDNSIGCPVAGGCNGYELADNIDLARYTSWVPVGSAATLFTATFEGNNYNISNLKINATSNSFQGLFGNINDAVIRNVHLKGVSIVARDNVGALVGASQGDSRIINSSVAGSSITARSNVGGLVGFGDLIQISGSGATFDEIKATGNNIGGLLGTGTSETLMSSQFSSVKNLNRFTGVVATIELSYATISNISGAAHVGGLVGRVDDGKIISSVVTADRIVATGDSVGGIAGLARFASLDGSMAMVNHIQGANRIGGLFGWTRSTDVAVSAAIVANISASANIGGLIGTGDGVMISDSYAAIVSQSLVSGEDHNSPLISVDSQSAGSFHREIMLSRIYWDNALYSGFAGYGGGGRTNALKTTNTFSGIFAEWGKIYLNVSSGNLETLESPPSPDSVVYVQAWNLDGFPDQYPLFNIVPITLARQNAAINRVLAGKSPVPAR